jgi:hypothetical protein
VHQLVSKKTLIMTRIVEGVGHKLYMDNFLSSLTCLMTWPRKKNYCCGTERLYRKGMPKDLKANTQRSKQGDIWVMTKGASTAVVWKDIHNPNREGNFWDKHGNAKRLAIVADYKCHMDYVNKVDSTASHSQQLHPSVFMWWEENVT